MIKETGQVVKIQEETIWVETAIKSTCQTCQAKSNCGTSSIAQAFAGKSVINEVHNHLDAKLHDWVEIGIPEDSLIRGASTMYLLPLLFALFGAAFSSLWLKNLMAISEGIVILVTAGFAWVGFWLASVKLKQQESHFQPQLLRVIEQNIEITQLTE